MLTAALAKHFYRRIARLTTAEDTRRLIPELFLKATEADRLSFSTRYARISYAAHKFGLERELLRQERHFRRERLGETATEQEAREWLRRGRRIATELTAALFDAPVPEELADLLAHPYPSLRSPEFARQHYQLRVVVVKIDRRARELTVRPEERSERWLTIPYGAPELADTAVPLAARRVASLPKPYVSLNLIRARITAEGLCYPIHMVIDPDYLVNVTDVAGCFGGPGKPQPWSSLPKRLLPFEKKPPLVRGSIINELLDTVIYDPEVKFATIKSSIFGLAPLELCLFDDKQVRWIMDELKHHFATVQKCVRELLPTVDIDRDKVLLEPSFYSPAFGLQGRLDLLQIAEREGETTSIVELKTSKTNYTNRHGLRPDNFIQTLLYDLMISHALGKDANVRSYILYSSSYEKPLRYAPPEFNRQLEALTARNALIALEAQLSALGSDPTADLEQQTTALMARLSPDRLGKLGSFTEEDHRRTLETYGKLAELERRYFGAFLGFTAREYRLAKVGEAGNDRANGLASLWLDERRDKVERFELLDGLRFRNYDATAGELVFGRGAEGDEQLAKFRQGDIVALYRTAEVHSRRGDALKSQVLKATVDRITDRTVHLRPRNPQLDDQAFDRQAYWCIEKDVLDSSFRNHYTGLYLWAAATPTLRRQWLGLEPPGRAEPYAGRLPAELTDEQRCILRKVITAPDYFLLWGPPGTGKTSKMLHHLAAHLLHQSEERLLLVAYTNRAVDEICESLERIRDADGHPYRNYLRIGSQLGTDERFRDRLLQERARQVRTRAELRGLIDRCRIVVGTVSSVGGRHELFQLKKFDRVVVDEASQILEPLLATILTRAPRALLIGDHRQLPAVVQQPRHDTVVHDAQLRELGLTDLSNSLFERLFLRAVAQGWHWAYDRLSKQGRMHERIMAFPALHFYGGALDVLPEGIAHRRTQQAPLRLNVPTNELQEKLCEQRLVFLSTATDHDHADPKVNDPEARLLVRLIEAFVALYADTPTPIQPGNIGIITPYRAQIAYVRRLLRQKGYSPDDYTVDTVERYQGSAKRIVLMSLCTNDALQMERLSELSEEGVDRKLNVAMTRAREHLVLLGCPDILRHSEVYSKLLDYIGETVQV